MPNLKLLARGKVRDLYELPDAQDADKLLFVATDRISAFDVIMENVSPATTATRSGSHQLLGLTLRHVDNPACLAKCTGHSPERHHPLHPLALLVPQALAPHPQPHCRPRHRLFLCSASSTDRTRQRMARVPALARQVPRAARGSGDDCAQVRSRQD